MVIKMMKWSPWPSMSKTRIFKVKVKPIKLKLLNFTGQEDDDTNNKIVVIKLKWKGEQRIGFGRRPSRQQQNEFSGAKIAKQEDDDSYAVNWENEVFENTCNFNVIFDSTGRHDQKFDSWDISFTILYGDETKSKGNLRGIGKAYMNIAEIVAEKKNSVQIEKTISINLQFGRVTRQAHLLVVLNFVEMRVDSNGQTGTWLNDPAEFFRLRRKNGNYDKLGSSQTQLESVKRMGLLNWNRRLSFKRPKVNSGKNVSRCCSCVNGGLVDLESMSNRFSFVDPVTSDSHLKTKVVSESKCKDEGSWESREVMSRDGQIKLKTNVFFASFDQCSNKAAGESACTVLVAVIAHWLLSNRTAMPTRPVFDNLIIQGSYEWRKLCESDTYTNVFPDKHFDLETVLHADLRPIAISRDDSFVGFFSPEKFESLKEAMSFDEIWSGIQRISAAEPEHEQRIYIISWNDHFFVLKVEANAYYIIDTLGERLFEGCNQAYILRFDDSTVMYRKQAKGEDEDEEIICSGKECCKEYINRFLASIPISELEAEEQKGAASYYSLHNRLQIELNFSYLISSSLASSPFSTSSNSASCYSTE